MLNLRTGILFYSLGILLQKVQNFWLGISSTTASLQQSPHAVTYPEWSWWHSSNNLSTASTSLHQRSRNDTCRCVTVPVCTDRLFSICNSDVEFYTHWSLPTVNWWFQGPAVRHRTCV